MSRETVPRQVLHLALGGELTDLHDVTQATVDNAHMRYFVVHLHELLDPYVDSL